MILNIIATIIMAYLISGPGSGQGRIFELLEHLCECKRPKGEGFWCERCGGIPVPEVGAGWVFWLVVGIWILLTFILIWH